MKINLDSVKEAIGLGDVVVCERGKYLIANDGNADVFHFLAIDLETFEKVNGYKQLHNIGGTDNKIYYKSGNIIKIYKSEELEIIKR